MIWQMFYATKEYEMLQRLKWK